jgi:acetylxylan esterase
MCSIYMTKVFPVAAAVVFGAVVRTAGEPYTASGVEKLRGGTNFNGTSPRSEAHLAGLQPYSEILREYCNFGDPICAVGSMPQDVAQHLNYFKLYVEDAAEWVVETVEGNLESRENVTVSASTSSSASKTKATATATATSAHTSTTHTTSGHAEVASSHVEAVAATTSSPESSASKHREALGCAAIVAVGYGALLFLL